MNVLRARVRENARPAPYDAVPIEPGIRPGRPASALIAPLRESHTRSPKCSSTSV
ncbi:hypothetical protein JCM10369A_16330 [Nocardioides pyridinolyticus]